MVKKTIIFDEETANKIEQLARENQRDFSKQIRFIIDEYLKLIQKKIGQCQGTAFSLLCYAGRNSVRGLAQAGQSSRRCPSICGLTDFLIDTKHRYLTQYPHNNLVSMYNRINSNKKP